MLSTLGREAVYAQKDNEQGHTHLINPGVHGGSVKEIVYTANCSPDPRLVSDGEMAADGEKRDHT